MSDISSKNAKTSKELIERLTNTNLLLTSAVVAIAGVGLAIFGGEVLSVISGILIGIGSSLIASVYITHRYSFIMSTHKNTDAYKWGLVKIFGVRAKLLQEVNVYLSETEETLDFLLFASIKMLRDGGNNEIVRNKVRNRLKLRILATNPDSDCLILRHTTKKLVEGSTREDHISLHKWVLELKAEFPRSSIEIKIYDYMMLEWYMKTDKYVFVGPHRYDMPSVNTITIGYEKKDGDNTDTNGYNYYTKYFEKLWEDDNFAKVPTKEQYKAWGLSD